MMKTINLILTILILPLFGFAGGGQLGNGGDVVVCIKGYKVAAELLDIFEARVLLGKIWKDDYRGGTAIEASTIIGVSKLLEQLDEKLPAKSARLRVYLESFFDEAVFLNDVELTDIPDSLQVALPAGCKISQVVIQSSEPGLGQKRYTINADLWKLMEPQSRMGLVLHEIIYRDQITLGHTDSRWTRYFNALIFNNDISSMSKSEIRDVLKQGQKGSFLQDGFELSGTKNSEQEVYQIVGNNSNSTTRYKVIDGRYDMKNHQVLDYTTDGPGEILGIFSDRGFAVVLDSNKVEKVLLSEGRLSDSLWLTACCNRSGKYIVVEGVDANGNLIFEEGSVKTHGKFSNGIKISNQRIVKGLGKGSEISDWLELMGCISGVCKNENNSHYNFEFPSMFGDAYSFTSFTYLKEQIVEGEGFDQLGIKNKVPDTVDPKGFDVIFSPYGGRGSKIKFDAQGGFSFETHIDLRNVPAKVIFKNGQIVEFEGETYCDVYFDSEGYLINLIPR